MKSKTNVLDGSSYKGLVLNSGTVTAKKFVGGNLNGKVTINGGTLIAPAIGTNGKLYGYITQLPTNKKDYVYDDLLTNYERVCDHTQKATVTVAGGEVDVTSGGYLGGMNAEVTVTGGKVALADGAVLGMTAAQQKTLADHYSSVKDNIANHKDSNIVVNIRGGAVETNGTAGSGSISTPYGKIAISGVNTAVKAANLKADHGDITIQEAKTAYQNPYTGSWSSKYLSTKIGVWIVGTLSGQNVSITKGAQVYAEDAHAEVSNNEGRLTVTESGLYAEAYGETGIVRADSDKAYNDTANAVEQTVFGTRIVSVKYVMNPQGILDADDMASAVNPTSNPETYTRTDDTQYISLSDATNKGYYFKGWYNNEACTGDPVTQLNTAIANDLTLYAKWEKVVVTFQIRMDASGSGYSAEEFTGNTNWESSTDSISYLSTKKVAVTYNKKILGDTAVRLLDYSTNTLGVLELEIQESGYTGTKTVNANTLVTKDLAEFYKTKLVSDPNAVIILHVKNVQKRFVQVTMDLNRTTDQNGTLKPGDAAIKGQSVGAVLSKSVEVGKALNTVSDFTDASATGNSEGLVQAAAFGYTFYGWNTNKDATKDSTVGWVTANNHFTANTTIYAVWQANTYLIEFSAGDGKWLTTENIEPNVGASESKTLYYYWIYDTSIGSADDTFWLKELDTKTPMYDLPYAWQEGYVFDHSSGWTYSYTDGSNIVSGHIGSTHELNQAVIKSLDIALGEPDGEPTTPALILTASYDKTTVSYADLGGGKWTDSKQIDLSPEYGTPLAGYVKSQDAGTGVEKIAEITGSDGTTKYAVASTMADYYSANKSFVGNDYRNTLSKKGYTFYGWYTSKDDAEAVSNGTAGTSVTSVGTLPRFHNLTVYAAWRANQYSLNLKPKKEGQTYTYTSFNAVDDVTGVSVTVGQEIASDVWPGRNSNWYAYNSTMTGTIADNSKRFFLGATFASLDPGTTEKSETQGNAIYKNYAQSVTGLQNSGTLYQSKTTQTEGTVFYLPEDPVYQNAIQASDSTGFTVPDYPTGSSIDLYAVYRERSLVFVERYIDPYGQLKQSVIYSGPWNNWYDIATQYGQTGSNNVTRQGYSFIGWYVNGITAEAIGYPADSAAYDSVKNSFKETAETNGTYDIMVYTVYAAQVTRNISLVGKTDPTDTVWTADTYTLPASMQNGDFSILVEKDRSNPFKLVTKAEMEQHLYDSSWTSGGTTYHADDTVAVQVTIVSGIDSVTKDLAEVQNGSIEFRKQMGAGGRMTLTLYHSKVITKESSGRYTLTAKFKAADDSSTLDNQQIVNNVTITLKPLVYTVNYTVNFPEKLKALTMSDQGDFAEQLGDGVSDDTERVLKTVKAAYGSALLGNLPILEGYEVVGNAAADGGKVWLSGENRYDTLTVPVTAANDGVIAVTASYQAKTYDLSADEETLNHWKVVYSDGVNGSASTELTPSGTDTAIKYHSTIRFTSKVSGINPPEYITLTLKDHDGNTVTNISKLPEYGAEESGTYTFQMPALDVEASYVTVETLYLEDGTISITEGGYTQARSTGEVRKTWPGSYVILQNRTNDNTSATANTLKLAGDLQNRTIKLGKLNISSNNSIELMKNGANGTKVSLTMDANNAANSIIAKNVKVPANGELTWKPGDNYGTGKASVALSPSRNFAAVGGTTVAEDGSADTGLSGKITMNNINLSLDMPAGSTASGVGPAVSGLTAASGEITLKDCQVSVKEGSSTVVYGGAWVGGDGVTNVKLDTVTMKRGNTNFMSGPRITAGDTVTLTNCCIGTEIENVYDPVYAKNQLKINNSRIYQTIQSHITDSTATAPIGTASGKTEINQSVIKTAASNTGYIKDLYTGTLYIKDAASDVTIAGSQIVEISNGAIKVSGNTYTQGTNSHTVDNARRNYVLLEEGTVTGTAPSLTVQGMVPGGIVEVRKPLTTGNTAQVSDLVIETDTTMRLKGDLNVSGKAELANGMTLNVNAGNNAGLNFTGTDHVFNVSSEANYVQDGGTLLVAGTSADHPDFGGQNLNVTLKNVSATVHNLYAKNLSVEGGTITAHGTGMVAGEVGSKQNPDSGASNVTQVSFKNTTVNAAKAGALGEYDKTFTKVSSDNSTINGTLVKDHYRLEYVTSGMELNTERLNHVVRTETSSTGSMTVVEVSPTDGVPGVPTGNDAMVFGSWYINAVESTGAGTAAERTALTNTSLPAGLTKRTTLGADTCSSVIESDKINNSDGTVTLKVYPWLNATGEAYVKKGRVFTTFTDTEKEVTIQQNGAWTAQLTSTGTSIIGRDYRVTFDETLPEGTALTLTVPGTTGSFFRKGTAGEYYYYQVPTGGATAVRFSQFTKMGGGDTFTADDWSGQNDVPDDETFLLAVDFAEADAGVKTGVSVKFALLPDKNSDSTAIELRKGSAEAVITYGRTAVQDGVVAVNGASDTVSITQLPTDDDRLTGQKLYLKAVLKQAGNGSAETAVSAPFTAKAVWGTTTGSWISRDTVLFEVGEYGNLSNVSADLSQEYSFTGLSDGTYSITWGLVYGTKTDDSIAGNIISKEVTVSGYTVTTPADTPKLQVTADIGSRVVHAGEAKAITFDYETSVSDDLVTVIAEKQNTLCAFVESSNSGIAITKSAAGNGSGTVTVTFPASTAAGTYRIRFSMDTASAEDDVYFVFVVTDK